MSMRGLWKSTGYWNTVESQKDWQALAEFAINHGLAKEVSQLEPPPEFGWRRIDKRISKLKEELSKIGWNVIKLPSANSGVLEVIAAATEAAAKEAASDGKNEFTPL